MRAAQVSGLRAHYVRATRTKRNKLKTSKWQRIAAMERKEEFLEEKKENLKMQETQRGALVNFGANFNFFFCKENFDFRTETNFSPKSCSKSRKNKFAAFFWGGVPSA